MYRDTATLPILILSVHVYLFTDLDPRVLKHLTGGVSLRGRHLHQVFDKIFGIFGDVAPVTAGERDLTKQRIQRLAGPAPPPSETHEYTQP